jgi:hypothetical protein
MNLSDRRSRAWNARAASKMAGWPIYLASLSSTVFDPIRAGQHPNDRWDGAVDQLK